MAQVSLVHCPNYDEENVLRSVEVALAPFGGMSAFVKPGQKVLCKVSMLRAATPDKAITTHPALAFAVASLVKEAGGEAIIGDSAGGADYGQSEKALKVCGYEDAAKAAGASTCLFETAGQTRIKVRNGSFLSEFHISKAVEDADVIINLPKLKTHIETLMTGGVKNMLGCLPGAGKLLVHRAAPSPWDLGQALLDIYGAVRPQLTIMDAVTAMEGNGPARGTPAHVGAVLASKDAVALDHLAARLIGYDPMKIPTIRPALERGIGENRQEKIEIIGAKPADFKPEKFKLASNAMMRSVPKPLLRLLNRRFFRVYPVWSKAGCELCDLCHESCPVEAMTRQGDTITIDYDKCINCFCCFELCPEKGIDIKKTLLAKILS